MAQDDTSEKKRYTAHNGEGEEVIRREIERRIGEVEKRRTNPRHKISWFRTSTALVLASIIGLSATMAITKHRAGVESEPERTYTDGENPEEYGKNDMKDGYDGSGLTIDEDSQIESEIEIGGDSGIEIIEKESNVTQTLTPGKVIEFEHAKVGNYVYSEEYGGTWVPVSPDEAQTSEQWCFAMHRETGNYGYVDATKYEVYSPYIAKNDKIVYKLKTTEPFNKSKECKVGSIVYIKDSQKVTDKWGNTLYKVLIQNEKTDGEYGYTYEVGYMDLTQVNKGENLEFSLGLMNSKTPMRSTPEIKDKDISEDKLIGQNSGVKYILDISSYNTYQLQDYLQTLKDLDERGLLGGVIMEIATTEKDANYGIRSVAGNEELDEKWNQIDKRFGKKVINKSKNLGDYAAFKRFIQETMKICPIGFYAYTSAITADEVSSMANVIAETEKQLQKDIPGFDQANKLPLVIDVEQGGNESNEVRTEAIAQTVKLLGHGTDYRFYWTLDNGEEGAKEGLNIIDKQYMLYTSSGNTASKKEFAKNSQFITSVEDVARKTSEYTLINFQAAYVDKVIGEDLYSQDVNTCLNPVGLLSKMNASNIYTTKFFSSDNIKEADIMQCMGNINYKSYETFKLPRQVIDISVCTTETYNAILDGTFKGHSGEFLDNLKKSIEENKEIYEYHKFLHSSEVEPNTNEEKLEDIKVNLVNYIADEDKMDVNKDIR